MHFNSEGRTNNFKGGNNLETSDYLIIFFLVKKTFIIACSTQGEFHREGN